MYFTRIHINLFLCIHAYIFNIYIYVHTSSVDIKTHIYFTRIHVYLYLYIHTYIIHTYIIYIHMHVHISSVDIYRYTYVLRTNTVPLLNHMCQDSRKTRRQFFFFLFFFFQQQKDVTFQMHQRRRCAVCFKLCHSLSHR